MRNKAAVQAPAGLPPVCKDKKSGVSILWQDEMRDWIRKTYVAEVSVTTFDLGSVVF